MTNALVVGGTSGIGLELAIRLATTHRVTIVGRHDPVVQGMTYVPVRLDAVDQLPKQLDQMLASVATPVDLLVYSVGSYVEGTVAELDDEKILAITAAGLLAPQLLLQRILRAQKTLDGFIAITSSSQWRPREKEPIYSAVKAGLGMFGLCTGLDPAVGKTLVVAPSATDTPFWDGTTRDRKGYLDPRWVADTILRLYDAPYRCKSILLLRDPPRDVEVHTDHLPPLGKEL